MRRSLWVLLLSMLLTAGCRLYDKILTHKYVLESASVGGIEPSSVIMADLEGRGVELQVASYSQYQDVHWIIVGDRYGKAISQINTGRKVRGMRVLADPRDNSQWLFYSFNDHRRVALTGIRYEWTIPLQRHEKVFESLGRERTPKEWLDREWFALIYPQILRDIDADGRLELVCSAYDGFTADPRGLVVYDFDTGKIKWRFETAANLMSVLVGDYDGNGSNEIIVSNRANKNIEDIRNQMDDMNCWVAVLDTKGNMLHHARYSEGYSNLQMVEADVDKDGRMDIYGLNSTWGALDIKNSVSILKWDGKEIKRGKTWALSSTLEQSLDNVILNDMDGQGKWRLLLLDKAKGLTALDKDLKPVPHNYQEFVSYIWDVEDVNWDGRKEVLLLNTNGEFVILDDNLHVRARLRNPFPQNHVPSGYIVGNGHDTPGFIALSGGGSTNYYGYGMESAFALVYRFIGAYMGIICLLMLLGMLRFAYLVYFRRKRTMLVADGLGAGMMVTTGKGKVIYTNKHASGLFPDIARTGRAASLQDIAPDLWSNVLRCGDSNNVEFVYDIALPESNMPVRFKVWLLSQKRYTGRYTLLLMPEVKSSEDMEAKLAWADIARRLSHNVRHHITNVVLALSELETRSGFDEEGRQLFAIIRGEIDKVRTFTHSFQRFTELEDYNLKHQDIIPSVEHCLKHLVLPPQIKLLKSWDMRSVTALIEPIRFEEALTNILNNAVEAMPSGGNLNVVVREFPAAASPQPGLNILVEVEDSGKGIPEKYLEDIWKPFFTTNHSGTGIGIPESRKIIASMGGKMLIQSEEGVGTVVSFWLKGSPRE